LQIEAFGERDGVGLGAGDFVGDGADTGLAEVRPGGEEGARGHEKEQIASGRQATVHT
jgi:hypothetical protein